MSDSNSKGTILFIFALGVFALGFWFVYDLSAKSALQAEMSLIESKRQIEQLNTKIDKIKNYFKVELDKIDEAENRGASQKGGGASGGLAGRVNDLESQVSRLNKESRTLRALIREYEDM